MKRIIFLLGVIFASLLFSCTTSVEPPKDDGVCILINGKKNVTSVEGGEKIELSLSNNASAEWTVSGIASATLSASSGTLVYLTARTAGSVTVTAATENGRKYTCELQITAKDTSPNEDNEPNVSFINRSAYRVSVCRDDLTNEIAVVGAGGTKSVYVSPGRGEITFHFRYSYCVIDDAYSGTVWMDAEDSSMYTYAIDSVDIAYCDVPVQIQIPAPKNPTFRDSYLVVENKSEQPVSLYKKSTQYKLHGQEKCYIQPHHSGAYCIQQPDVQFEGFSLKSSSAESAVFPFYAESGVVYKCEFDGSGAYIDIAAYAPWGRIVVYTVKHYQQNDDLENYTLIKTENLTGIADKITAATALSYKGFSARPFEQKSIFEYGTTVVEIYYDRNEYTVTFDSNNGTGDKATQIFYYGVPQNLNENIFSYPGYTFSGWGLSETDGVVYANQAEFCGEYTSNVTLYAKWGSGITVTGDTVGNIDLTGITGEYTIKVVGAISQSTLTTLADKMKYKKDILVNLDLSEAVLETIEALDTSTSTVPNSIFYCCPLYSIILPETLKTIGERAFSECGNLTSVEIPGVETIGGWAFYDCDNLTSVEIPGVKTIGDGAFYDCDNLTSVEIPGVETIGERAFCGCDNLTSVEIPGVKTIGEQAFYGCYNLESVKIDGAETVGDFAFCSCKNLSSISIDAETIGSNAFEGCTSLTSVIIGKNVKSIGNGCFSWCTALTWVQFEDTENWYWYNSSDLQDVTDATENARRIKDSSNRAWVKK